MTSRTTTPLAIEPMDIDGMHVIMRMRRERFRPDFPIPQPDGSTKRQNRSWPSRQEAIDGARRIITDARNGIDAQLASEMTVDALGPVYIEKYLIKVKNRAPNTLLNVNLGFRQLSPYIGSITLAKLKTADVERAIEALQDRGLGLGTIKSYYSALRGGLNYAMKKKILSVNVASLVENLPTPPTQPERRSFLSEGAMADVLDELHSLPAKLDPVLYEVIADAFSCTGGRISDCMGLNRSDIDREALSVTLRSKTKKGYRTISIDEDLLASIDRLSARWTGSDGPVFVQPNGKVPHYDTVRRRLTLIKNKLGLTSLHPHLFRHFHASRLLAGGLKLHNVKERLGHAHISITSDLYGHLERDDDSEVIAAVNARVRTMRSGNKAAVAEAELLLSAAHAPEAAK